MHYDKNFYPTPDSLIEKMVEPYKINFTREFRGENYEKYYYKCFQGNILDPSAGSGAILEFAEKEASNHSLNIYAVELDSNMQSILRGKSFKLIGSDFLTFDSHIRFDYILMNPPFDQGAKHLLKAWEIANGTDIVCVLNANTLRNPHTLERKRLHEIIEQNNGKVEFYSQEFKNAERSTNVEIAIVRLTKEKRDEFDFDTSSFEKVLFDFPDDIQNNKPAVTDALLDYEHRYNATIEAFKEMARAQAKFHYLIDAFHHDGSTKDYHEMANKKDLEGLVSSLNGRAWQTVLKKSKFTSFLTSQVEKDILSKFEEQKNIKFSKQNALEMLDILWSNKGDILDQCILEIFDLFTKHHEDNRCYEGFRTNDAYKVNRKVIFKYGWISTSWSGKLSLEWSKRQIINDIDRAMCHIMGMKLSDLVVTDEDGNVIVDKRFSTCLEKTLESCPNVSGALVGNTGQSHFFKYKFFKKGTVHIEFKDKKVWEQFNYQACRIKGFPLPGHTRKSDRQHAKQSAA